MEDLYGAIEAGGTKFVCAVGNHPDDLKNESNRTHFETTTREETIGRAIEFFNAQEQRCGKALSAIGIGSFGPIDLNHHSKTYGYITSTPKRDWKNTNFVGMIKGKDQREFNIPIGFDTDVNAAALGEHVWGAAQGLSDFIYLTIGTGIGGGGMVNGKLMHGLIHPEMGHIFLPRAPKEKSDFKGTCPFHGDRCLEGLASGPAIEERWKVKSATDLEATHEAWDLEAHYIALGLVNYICTLSPQRIILGGGVMEQKQLLPLIHDKVKTMLNGYIQADEILNNIQDYIVLPGLGNRAGVIGALELARQQVV
jgi:fructokinase